MVTFTPYSSIFGNAKTTVDKADKKRLIKSLKALLEQSDMESTVDVEEVIRYFVVHDFLVNGDSYTGQMIHNYYLYEEDGQLSMIPWDYNLAYGSFMGGNASSSVNSPIDTPVSNGMSDRPMVSWIFDNEEYTEMYHQLFSEFIDSVDFEKLVADTAELIDKYVEKDPTKFCTYEEFKTGVEAISSFCTLREESVSGQLDGTIPSTTEGQKADDSALIDASDLNTSDMGSMGGGKGGFGGFGGGAGDKQKGGFGKPDKAERADKSKKSDTSVNSKDPDIGKTLEKSGTTVNMLSFFTPLSNENSSSSDRQPPQGFDGERPDFGGQPPEGFDPENMPDGFTPGDMPGGFSPNGGYEDENEDGEDISETEEKSSEEVSDSAEQEENFERPGKPGGENRPSPGNFSPMDGGAETDYTTAYILLGISALILLFGIGFALKFRR